ncbi:MAG: PKD domain-containing protein [Gemmatimonadetes bacterium]|nr:PKD domain-containing protein [Gemmatimonadota bacterium]
MGGGSGQVTLTVTDGGGLSNSVTQSVTVTVPTGNQPPVANFTVNCNTGKARQCAFDGTSSSDDVGVVSYSWNFGDGTIGSVNPTKHTYPTSGSKTVTLTVTDGGGLTNSKTVVITVP